MVVGFLTGCSIGDLRVRPLLTCISPITKRIVRIFGSFICLTLFVACATPPEGPPYVEAKAQAPRPGHAVLYIFREYAEPTAFAATIQIDGKEVASLAQGGFTWFYAKPGLRKIVSTWGISGQPEGVMEIQIAEGRTYYVAVLGQAKARLHGMVGVVPIASARFSSGFVEVSAEASELKLARCCRFQKPLLQEF